MPIKKCFHCNKITLTPYHVTEINKAHEVQSYDLCKKCGELMMELPKTEKVDLSHIETPEQLLQFITGMEKLKKPPEPPKPPCPNCGWTIEEFDKRGRFGCPTCYSHFTERMEQLVYPYHNAREHLGKIPKRYLQDKCESSPVEKIKLLKLRLAKAIELEEYEKAAEIKIQLQDVQKELGSSSEGQ